MRLPVQLWKYSCATTLSIASKIVSVAVSGEARMRRSLKMLRPLFSIAPMLKSETATMLNTSRSYSRPKRCSSHRMERLSESIAQAARACFAVLDVDGEVDVAPGHGAEGGADRRQVAADEREQVAGLGVRVVPHGVVPLAAVERAALLQVAVGEQDGRRVRIGVDAHGVGGEHVGAVEEIGDAAEALRLALARVDVVAAVDALQRLVGLRIDEGGDLQREGTGSASWPASATRR